MPEQSFDKIRFISAMLTDNCHTLYSSNKGELVMTDNEIKLLNMVRENENPEQALITAIEIVLVCLANPNL